MRKILSIISIISILLSFTSFSNATMLGAAGDYNVFISGDMTVNASDSQGRVAAGGNINMSNYSIGLLAGPSDYSMVSGGDINFTSGSVKNGGIFSGGNATLSHLGISGKVVANGWIDFTSGSSAGMVPNAGISVPVDFTDSFNYLNYVSSALAAMEVNGTTTITPWHSITLAGNDHTNIFSLAGTDLSNAKGLFFDIGADDIAIVNVSGDTNEFSAFGIFGTDGKEGNILYNFYDSDQLSIHNIAVKGSILAPSANVVFNSGTINGTLVADSVTGSGQFNSYNFDHDVPVNIVPEPATITLFLSGATILLGFKKRI